MFMALAVVDVSFRPVALFPLGQREEAHQHALAISGATGEAYCNGVAQAIPVPDTYSARIGHIPTIRDRHLHAYTVQPVKVRKRIVSPLIVRK